MRVSRSAVPPSGVKDLAALIPFPTLFTRARSDARKRERSGLVNNLTAGDSPAGSRSFAPTLHGSSAQGSGGELKT